MRVGANAGRVFAKGNIANIVVSIFNPPMIADYITKAFSIKSNGGDIKGGFVSINPSLAFCIEELAKSIHFDQNLDRVPFIGVRKERKIKELDLSAFNPIAALGRRLLVNSIW